ncbi:hypothetical protein [Nocardia farcinica]
MSESVEEASGSVAAMVAAALRTSELTGRLLRGSGAESRAYTEHVLRIQRETTLANARLRNLANEDARAEARHSTELHNARRRDQRADEDLERRRYADASKDYRDQEAHQAVIATHAARRTQIEIDTMVRVADAQRRAADSDARNRRDDARNEAELNLNRARRDIAWADFERREDEGRRRDERATAEHNEQMRILRRRDERAADKHQLEMQEITERIEQRRRSVGLTETLATGQRHYAKTVADAAAFAAATTTADMGSQARHDADAYAERAHNDGFDPTADPEATPLTEEQRSDLHDAAIDYTIDAVDAHHRSPGDSPRADNSGPAIGESIRATTSPDCDTAPTPPTTSSDAARRNPEPHAGPDAGP